MAEHRLALFPGSFDPVTNGHLDVIARAAALFDEVEVAVGVNVGKEGLFSVEERVRMIASCTGDMTNVTVGAFEGLVVAYARRRGAGILIRGVRQATDFDYEQRMAFANRRLHPGLETLFMVPSEQHALVSASLVREIHAWGGDIRSFVPAPVAAALDALRNSN